MNLTQRPIYQKTGNRKVKAIRQDARGRECSLKIPGVCCHDPARTVGCHMRLFGFGGMGLKPDDIFIIDACDCCHAVLDSRSRWTEAALGFDDILRAFMVTLEARRRAGLIHLGKDIAQ
ncbi:nuclease domain-containing protein [Salipiger thiooxidans]|uniref:nuclease domain-containing protein n=1 Tax=Salipiger thiooxidans TaxID=282683 RepID=UPI001CD42FB9|nr:nuclease domain-containing protein [Salipiger thiooxidans]MCA0846082.1 DUF1364 domain-containing protein [Salipiger thiooxidans]